MHSGLSSEERTLLASEFSQSTILVLFCTSVLEMGIDKDNFATMVNVGPFHSIESLLQRAGRAGRRGQRTNIIVLYADQKSDYKDKAKDSGKETELILGMQYSVRMLLATTTCRRAYLLRYMEDADALAGRVLSGQFGCCDNCLDKTPDVDCGYELAWALEMMFRHRGRQPPSLPVLIKMLTGASTKEVRDITTSVYHSEIIGVVKQRTVR